MKTDQEYRKDPGRCPNCEATEFVCEEFLPDGDQVTQEVLCVACGFGWLDVYVLAHFTRVNAPRDEAPFDKCECGKEHKD